MKVPLSANPIVYKKHEYFVIWKNGKKKLVKSTVSPYFYSKDKIPNIRAKEKEITGYPLSNITRKRKFYQYKFRTRKQAKKWRGYENFSKPHEYIIRTRLDDTEFFKQYPNDDDLKFLFLDIEQLTKDDELFPAPTNLITSISFCDNSRDIKTYMIKKDSETDRHMILAFIKKFKEIDPDVIVYYNATYDIPRILRRCEALDIDTSLFSRTDREPYITRKKTPVIDGRLIYDPYTSVRADQSLTGNVTTKGLKDVSNYFGYKEERKPLTPKQMTEYIGTKTLADYNRDDVERLLLVFDVYWQNIEFNANDLKIPLSMSIDMNTTKLGMITIGDEYKKRNIIADGRNMDRFPEIFKRDKEEGEPNYQGALVGIYKHGKKLGKDVAISTYYKPMYKVDYSSMYPTIMSSFNLSPDTTTLVEYLEYQKDGFKIEEKDDHYIYYIPDDVLEKTVVLKVLKKQGFESKLVWKFLDERAKYKKKHKKTGNLIYKSLSLNRKVKANGGVYGNQGSALHPFGFAPIAIGTCGFGRECGQLLINLLEEMYPDSVVEVDSITGDTPIFIRDKTTKEIDIIPIEDLSTGKLRETVSNLETLTKSGWKNINYIYCHEVEKNIHTIDTRGARIDVTEDHSVFSNGKEIVPKSLSTGDIIDIYPPKDYGGNDTSINKNKAWFYGFFLSDGTISIRHRKNNIFDMMSYELRIGKSNRKLLEKAKSILKNDFGIDSKISNIGNVKSYDKDFYRLDIITKRKEIKMNDRSEYSKSRKEFIENTLKICYCKDTKTKKVPKSILNTSSKKVIDSFFEGLRDGDGSIAKDKKNFGKFSIGGIFKPMIAGISYLFDRKGITYNVFSRKDKLNITQIITHKPKEYCSRIVKKGNPGIISKQIINKEKRKVYDIGTSDGTFVAGVGRVICHNTDGVYFSAQNFNEKELLKRFNKELKSYFGKDNLELSVDIDPFVSGYFYKAKNYTLLTEEGKIIYHGVAMKASSKNEISRSLIKKLAYAKLHEKPIEPIIEEYLKLDFSLKDFAMNVELGMPIREYKNKNSIGPRMASQAQVHFGVEPEVGNSYAYVKTHAGYKLLQLSEKRELDLNYYREQVEKIANIFSVKTQETKMDEWM